MATKHQQMQRLIRLYREETGNSEVVMKEVARFAVKKGWPLPPLTDPLERLAKEFSQAAREEVRHDEKTNRPYRANHAIIQRQGDQQMTFWLDIDDPTVTRPRMLKSLVQRREQMVGDAVQLTFDQDHWNSIHPTQEPISLPLDLTLDVEWRKNGTAEKAS